MAPEVAQRVSWVAKGVQGFGEWMHWKNAGIGEIHVPKA